MSTLKTVTILHPSSAVNNLVNDASGNVAVGNNLTVAGTSTISGNETVTGTVAMGSSFKRNRIINGNMVIDQRNAGASVTIADSTITYGVDRFLAYESTSASSCTVQQVSDAPNSATNGVVFTNSLKFTVGTGGTATASQLAILEQRIEGYNVADFGYGASGALTTTLRFWVKSSVTGTFCVGLRNANDTRSYVSTYTISAANTWEQKTITITGDTTGTWNTTNGSGLQIRWDLGSGSTYQTSTLNAWQAGLYFSNSAQANLIGTSSATFAITGVQLEVGTKATPYEMQIYSDQLAQCQRYYYKFTAGGVYTRFAIGEAITATYAQVNLANPVPMRTSATSIEYLNIACYDGATLSSATAVLDSPASGPYSTHFVLTTTGMTAYRTAFVIANNTTSSYVAASAEL